MSKSGAKFRLLNKLADCAKSGDTEVAHADADAALLEYIGDPDVTAAYERVSKWYA